MYYVIQGAAGSKLAHTATCTGCTAGRNIGVQSALKYDATAPTNVSLSGVPTTARGTLSLTGVATESESSLDITFEQRLVGAPTWTTIGSTVTAAPYVATFDTTTVADGNYEFRIVALNGAGDTTTSATVTTRIVNGMTAANTLLVGELTGAAFQHFVPGTNTQYYNPVGGPGTFTLESVPQNMPKGITFVGQSSNSNRDGSPLQLNNPGVFTGDVCWRRSASRAARQRHASRRVDNGDEHQQHQRELRADRVPQTAAAGEPAYYTFTHSSAVAIFPAASSPTGASPLRTPSTSARTRRTPPHERRRADSDDNHRLCAPRRPLQLVGRELDDAARRDDRAVRRRHERARLGHQRRRDRRGPEHAGCDRDAYRDGQRRRRQHRRAGCATRQRVRSRRVVPGARPDRLHGRRQHRHERPVVRDELLLQRNEHDAAWRAAGQHRRPRERARAVDDDHLRPRRRGADRRRADRQRHGCERRRPSSDAGGTFTIARTDYGETQGAAASGLAASTLTRDAATYTNGSCGTYSGSPTTIVGNPNQTLATGATATS